jgi:hypothetical protein
MRAKREAAEKRGVKENEETRGGGDILGEEEDQDVIF